MLILFCIFFSKNSGKIMEKISVLILGFIVQIFICHPYVTMPNVSLNLV